MPPEPETDLMPSLRTGGAEKNEGDGVQQNIGVIDRIGADESIRVTERPNVQKGGEAGKANCCEKSGAVATSTAPSHFLGCPRRLFRRVWRMEAGRD
jgi:hypothetical protein